MFTLMKREHSYRTVAFLVLLSLLLSLTLFDLLPFKPVSSRGASVKGSPSGDGGDENPATFKFRKDNSDVQVISGESTPIALDEVPSWYGRPQGMRIFVSGVDVTDPGYTGPGGPKKPVGMDLSESRGWPNVYVPSGKVAIDPVIGRFKFYEKASAGNYDTGVALDVFVRDKYAYVADGGDLGFQIIDVSTPEAPKLTGDYTTKTALGIFVSGNYAYMATAVGLQILDISKSDSPKLVGKLPTENAMKIFVSGNQAYMTTLSGLQIIDVSNPINPRLTGSYATNDAPSGIFVRGNLAFLAAGGGGLYILSVSNPASPTLFAQLGNEPARGVYVSGNYAYVAAGEAGLKVINISNPSVPSIVGVLHTPGGANQVFVTGNLVYLAAGDAGVLVVDVSNPARPTTIQNFDTPGSAMGLFVTGSRVYVADHASGLQVIGLTTPPSEIPQGPVTADYHYTTLGKSLEKGPTKPVEKGKILRFASPNLIDKGPAKFAVHFKNVGSAALKVGGVIRIKGSYGQKLTFRLKSVNVLPGKTKLFRAAWENPPSIGIFSAEAKLNYGAAKKKTLSSKSTFLTFPWKIGLAIGAILVLTFLGERWLRRRKNLVKA